MNEIKSKKEDLEADYIMITSSEFKYLAVLISFSIFVFWKAFDLQGVTSLPVCGKSPCFHKSVIFNAASLLALLATIVVIHLNISTKIKMVFTKSFFFIGIVFTSITLYFFTTHVFKALDINSHVIIKIGYFSLGTVAVILVLNLIIHRND